ncbi:hypothetical protein J4Q44_G00265890 [Coregonus suidteri]|uniref:Uncharacterized protein n=1 Tax=Coregonus suidteri TaxID=861788 RepID=A0AAN8L636_9TELE
MTRALSTPSKMVPYPLYSALRLIRAKGCHLGGTVRSVHLSDMKAGPYRRMSTGPRPARHV